MLLCKGLCDQLPEFHRFVDGFKYCGICEHFIQSETIKCPCCHGQMRVHSRQWGKKQKKHLVYY